MCTHSVRDGPSVLVRDWVVCSDCWYMTVSISSPSEVSSRLDNMHLINDAAFVTIPIQDYTSRTLFRSACQIMPPICESGTVDGKPEEDALNGIMEIEDPVRMPLSECVR